MAGEQQPKVIASVQPDPKFKLPPETKEEIRVHSMAELDNLKQQLQAATEERAGHERRLAELVGIQNQLQGAMKELQAFSMACGIDLNAEEQKALALKNAQLEAQKS